MQKCTTKYFQTDIHHKDYIWTSWYWGACHFYTCKWINLKTNINVFKNKNYMNTSINAGRLFDKI